MNKDSLRYVLGVAQRRSHRSDATYESVVDATMRDTVPSLFPNTDDHQVVKSAVIELYQGAGLESAISVAYAALRRREEQWAEDDETDQLVEAAEAARDWIDGQMHRFDPHTQDRAISNIDDLAAVVRNLAQAIIDDREARGCE